MILKKILNHKLLLIFIFGILLQVAIMPRAYHGDMTNYNGWGKYILEHGPSKIYNFSFRGQLLSDANYPPLMLWLCAIVSIFARFLKDTSWHINLLIPAFPSKLVFFFESEMPYIYIFKLILILANAAIAWLIYIFIKHRSPKNNDSLVAVSLFLFNPAIIYGSTFWGQIDILPILFILAAIYILFYRKQLVFSAILMAVAILFKQTTVIFLPIYFLAVMKHFGIKNLLKIVGVLIIVIWMGYAPFVNKWTNILSPFDVYLNKVQLASDNHFTTKSAWNMWVIIHNLNLINDLQKVVFGISYNLIGYSALFICLLITLFIFWRRKTKKTDEQVYLTVFAFFLIAVASFLFLTRLHERHLLQAVPFFILLYEKNKSYLAQYLYLSLFIVTNLFFIWHPISLELKTGFGQLFIIKMSIIIILGIYARYELRFSQLSKKKQ